jgi:hypothetical protein
MILRHEISANFSRDFAALTIDYPSANCGILGRTSRGGRPRKFDRHTYRFRHSSQRKAGKVAADSWVLLLCELIIPTC